MRIAQDNPNNMLFLTPQDGLVLHSTINRKLKDEMVVTVIATGYDLKSKNNGVNDLTSEIFKDPYKDEVPNKPNTPQVETKRQTEINNSFETINKPAKEKSTFESSTSNLPDWLKVKYKK